uniref:Uncharacterized protein n=1 Tax=Timema monikensis TaxID=170555 RepID=A0A7R9HKU8_9NEOP|nr:unnamed protein product [Timema monikensis]
MTIAMIVQTRVVLDRGDQALCVEMHVHTGYPFLSCATFTSPRRPTSTVVCVDCVCRAAAGPELPRCCLADMRATRGCQICSEEDILPASVRTTERAHISPPLPPTTSLSSLQPGR